MNDSREPFIQIRLTAGEVVECLVDTGFSGALVLPRSVVSRLGLTVMGSESCYAVGDRLFVADVTFAEVEWLGMTSTVKVIIDEVAILGAELLDRTKLVVDYARHAVTISREVGAEVPS